MKAILAALTLVVALAGITPAAVAGDKEYVCHITHFIFGGESLEGHVISVSVSAVPAHCRHRNPDVPDHYPADEIGTAGAACDGEVGNAFDRCMDRNLIGADCSRTVGDEELVALLCAE